MNSSPRWVFMQYVLDPEQRTKLLQAIPPKFDKVIAHHVTYRYKVPYSPDLKMPAIRVAKLVGEVYNDKLQAVIVSINNKFHTPEDKIYHITWSLDSNSDAAPKDSAELAATHSWQLPASRFRPISLKLEPVITPMR